MKLTYIFFIAATITFFVACDLEKEVDLNLPPYERELTVECYLEPGKPYRLVLTESVGYFDEISTELPVIQGAKVYIEHNGTIDTLVEGLYFDQDAKLYNYGSDKIVPADFDNEFVLTATDSLGRTLTARTKIMPLVELDSINLLYTSDSAITLLTAQTDNPDQVNFYRRMMHKTVVFPDSLKTGFPYDDSIINGDNNSIIIGSPPVFRPGDTAIISLFHITEDYYNFLNTIDAAESNNGNPFGQPGAILTNVEGGRGIFTGFSIFRQAMILPE